jgi:formylglycine-generating enzyme required for sulfatase activity
MTIVALAEGGAYCIDQAEVSKGQYNKFVTANVPVSEQAGACLTANATFIPGDAWPPAEQPGTLAFNLGLPVHYVDWCDAFAYCKWAKKQLCGNIDGTALAPADANSASKGAWYNACSAQGTKAFPYGSATYDPTLCNGSGIPAAGGVEGPATTADSRKLGFGYGQNHDANIYDVAVSDRAGVITGPSHKGCQGASVGLYQMSGNVAEWEDSCDGTSATSLCRVRGGSYAANDDPAALRCDAVRAVARMPNTPEALADIGIRCCVY